MAEALTLGKFSIGIGDRFAHQAKAQLSACLLAADLGLEIIPVWNKSQREHLTIGSEPQTTRRAADDAVKQLGWRRPYHVDADHIRLETVERFLDYADFFTIDVADSIGRPAGAGALKKFLDSHPELIGRIEIAGIEPALAITRADVERIANKYLLAVEQAGKIYRHIAKLKGAGQFITEVSMDETDRSQSPLELLLILAALADQQIPLQTIAPKFTGRFNKGVDYVGDLTQFEKEFNEDLAILEHAKRQYALPGNLKLSVHSGSDKFSLYPPMRRALKRFDAGLHLKTAGTTWLEELIGLAEAGGGSLALAREIYAGAYAHREDLCGPYAAVIAIDPARLPSPHEVAAWTGEQFIAALRHDPACAAFNPDLRQLLHVGYKIAAKMGDRYLQALKESEAIVARNVRDNLFLRHLQPLFCNAAAAGPAMSAQATALGPL